jgi:hypothetical protein
MPLLIRGVWPLFIRGVWPLFIRGVWPLFIRGVWPLFIRGVWLLLVGVVGPSLSDKFMSLKIFSCDIIPRLQKQEREDISVSYIKPRIDLNKQFSVTFTIDM